jgi:hypothetical protein
MGNSAMEWTFFAPKLKKKFLISKCWSLVEPPPGCLQAASDAVAGIGGRVGPALTCDAILATLVEDAFTMIRPDDASEPPVRVMLDRQINEAWDHYQHRIWALQANVNGLHHRTVRARMDAAHESFEKARAHIENSSMTVYNYLASLMTAYDKAKRHHNEQVADCLKVFDDCLGPAATSVVRLELLDCRFRAAYVKLHMHYSTGLGGAQNTSGLMAILAKISWQPEHLKLLEHAENIDTVCGLLASQGVVIPEAIRVNYLLDSIERSVVTDYEKDIEEARRQNLSMVQVMGLNWPGLVGDYISLERWELMCDSRLSRPKENVRVLRIQMIETVAEGTA